MKKLIKKAFTLVELLVVIAILAALATVGIVSFSAYTKRANNASDNTLLSQINHHLAIMDSEGVSHDNYTEMKDYLSESGIEIDKLSIDPMSKGCRYVWNIKENKMYLLEGSNKIIQPTEDAKTIDSNDKYLYFVPVNSDSEVEVNGTYYGYSCYLREKATSDGTLNISASVDTGNNTNVKTINYTNVNGAKDVVIRTNGGKLIINDTVEGNKQTHYGIADSVEVTTAMTSFHTHGKIFSMTLNAGKVVAEDNGFVYLVEVAAASEGVTQLAQENGGVIVVPTDSTTTTIKNASAVKDLGYTVTETGTTVSAERDSKTTYTISSKAELLEYVKKVNNGDYFGYIPTKLTADIDISGYEWTPIGNWEHPWFGTFNGNGHKIIGLTASVTVPFEDENDSYEPVYTANTSVGYGVTFGFFGIVGNGDVEISNVEFASTNINLSNGKNVGSVIGFAPSTKKFGSDASMNAGVGNTQCSKLAVDNVKTSGTVSGAAHVGGLIGKVYTTIDVAISNCENTAAVTVSKSGGAGGVVACVSGPTSITFTSCKNSGTITRLSGASAYGTAGIVGNSAVPMTLDSCTNSGTIINNSTAEQSSANGTTAGIAGNVKNTDLTVKDCSNSGAVTSKSNGAAGIIGGNASTGFYINIKLQGTISNTGNITAANYASGIIGLVSTASKKANAVSKPTIDVTSLTSITYKGSLNTTVDGGVTADYLCYKGGAGIFKSMSDTTTVVE